MNVIGPAIILSINVLSHNCFLIIQATKTSVMVITYASCEWFKATIIQNCLSIIFGHGSGHYSQPWADLTTTQPVADSLSSF